jgi:hypothetical protein
LLVLEGLLGLIFKELRRALVAIALPFDTLRIAPEQSAEKLDIRRARPLKGD